MRAAPTPAALIACPRNLELRYMSISPSKGRSHPETSRRIEDLVSLQCVRFNWQDWPACNCANRLAVGHLQNTQTNRRKRTPFFGQWKPQIVAKFGSGMLPICNKDGREIGMGYQRVILCSRTDFVTT